MDQYQRSHFDAFLPDRIASIERRLSDLFETQKIILERLEVEVKEGKRLEPINK